MSVQPAPALTAADLSALTRLLLNSWSAEYALRLTPMIPDEDFTRKSMTWTFPQAYYAPLFSARAVLLAMGTPTANEDEIRGKVWVLASFGFYRPAGLGVDFFETLSTLRISATNQPKPVGNIYSEQARLIEEVNAIALVHEAFIINKIGWTAYGDILRTMPDYLREAFLNDRVHQLAKSK